MPPDMTLLHRPQPGARSAALQGRAVDVSGPKAEKPHNAEPAECAHITLAQMPDISSPICICIAPIASPNEALLVSSRCVSGALALWELAMCG